MKSKEKEEKNGREFKTEPRVQAVDHKTMVKACTFRNMLYKLYLSTILSMVSNYSYGGRAHTVSPRPLLLINSLSTT